MKRRTILTIATGSLATVIVGCVGDGADDEFADPEADPFPVDVENAERGGAETVVSKTVEAGSEYEDASIECANEAHGAVRDQLEQMLDDLSDIEIGRGRGPKGFDGMAVTVRLIAATYDRDGELVAKADLEFEEVVAVTPPTAYLQTERGERVCAVPVYVERAELYID